MERCVRIYLNNVILEKNMDSSGGQPAITKKVMELLERAEVTFQEKDVAFEDNWEQGFIKITVHEEANFSRFLPADDVIVLSIRHDYNPGPVKQEPREQASPPAPPPVPPKASKSPTKSAAPQAKTTKPAASSPKKPTTRKTTKSKTTG